MRLKDKVAIITGTATGIGEGIATLFAAEGAKVFLLDREGLANESVANAILSKGGFAQSFIGDVRDPGPIGSAVGAALSQFGRIDILINNVGVYPRRPFLDMTEIEWDEVQDTNLKSIFRCTKAILPHMVSKSTGKIVNISSVAFHLGSRNLTHYAAAKGGVIGLTRSLAREFGPHNVYVNCIAPGAILVEKEREGVTEEKIRQIIALQSIQRLLLPIDIAKVCVFLSSEQSDGMTGQTLNVNGGWVMH